MAEFTPITTQEEFDKAIGERLKRERDTVKKQYEGYLSPDDVKKQYEGYLSPDDVKKQYEGYLSPEQAAEKDKKIREYESSSVKMRIAHENNIPYELANRLNGDTEDAIKEDAENLARLLGRKGGAPLASTEPKGGDSKRAALKKMLSELKEE